MTGLRKLKKTPSSDGLQELFLSLDHLSLGLEYPNVAGTTPRGS
jgi:hypothetical protein